MLTTERAGSEGSTQEAAISSAWIREAVAPRPKRTAPDTRATAQSFARTCDGVPMHWSAHAFPLNSAAGTAEHRGDADATGPERPLNHEASDEFPAVVSFRDDRAA